MAYQDFKSAYFINDPVAAAIGRAMDVAHTSLVEQALIDDLSSTYWVMCDVAWKAHHASRMPS